MTNLEAHGPPTIEIASLRIWVHGYQFPELHDAWDGNWLRCTARCVEAGASVVVTGAILDTVSIHRFQRALADVYKNLDGVATLESHEPELKTDVRVVGRKGDIEVRVEITPDQLTQRHSFLFMIDQSFIPEIIRSCERLLDQYPVRDPAGRGL